MRSKEGRSGGMVDECSHGDVWGAQTVYRTTEGNSKAFNVKV